MKNQLYFAFLFFIGSFFVPFDLDLLASGINQKKSKVELIEKDLAKARKDVLSSREYSLNQETLSKDIDVLIKYVIFLVSILVYQSFVIISLPLS